MQCVFIVLVLCVGFSKGGNETCPNGWPILKRGLSDADRNTVIDGHNDYRIYVANGAIEGQPRGVNLKKMIWDNDLANLSQSVSKTCEDNHIIDKDARFGEVGQNIFTSMNSSDDGGIPRWKTVMHYWFKEHSNFRYNNMFTGQAGHYTQMVWADTNHLGCDYIYFKNLDSPRMPFTKIYTCNYGPAGNIYGHPPYRTGKSGCEKLC